jgi:hypothetical protein
MNRGANDVPSSYVEERKPAWYIAGTMSANALPRTDGARGTAATQWSLCLQSWGPSSTASPSSKSTPFGQAPLVTRVSPIGSSTPSDQDQAAYLVEKPDLAVGGRLWDTVSIVMEENPLCLGVLPTGGGQLLDLIHRWVQVHLVASLQENRNKRLDDG